MIRTFRHALLLLALPLALAGCGKEKAEDAAVGESAAPLATVAPPAGKAWSDVISTTPDLGYRMGNPDAPIKLVEFASLTCPHCAEFAAKGFAPLRDKYVASGRVSFELRNFVRDPLDMTAAMLTRCGSPVSYFALTEQVFANQPAMFEKAQAGQAQAEAAAKLPENQRFVGLARAFGLGDFFAARGVSSDQAAACLAKGQDAAALAQAAQAQGGQHNITGTPSFLVNGNNANVSTWEELEPLLQRMGAR
jgi:protein-disulfide isomerase